MQIVGISATKSAFSAVAQRSNREPVVKWIKRTLERQLRRDTSLLTHVVGNEMNHVLIKAMRADNLTDQVCQKILEEWVSGVDVYIPSKDAVAALLQRASDTIDWLESLDDSDRRIKRIDRMSWEEAEAQSQVWHDSLSKASTVSDVMEGVQKTMDLPGGAFIAELNTFKALQNEGNLMQHCVGGYWKRVENGSVKIFSLRDAGGMPHATIELNRMRAIQANDGGLLYTNKMLMNGMNFVELTTIPWHAVQIRGKQNNLPIKKYQKLIDLWLEKESIQWSEFGSAKYNPQNIDKTKVFTAFGKSFTNPEDCIEYAEPIFEKKCREADADYFGKIYLNSGLRNIHAEIDEEKVIGFFDRNKDVILKNILKCSEKGLLNALQLSGLEFLPISSKGSLFVHEFFKAIRQLEAAYNCEEAIICRLNDKTRLSVFTHRAPLLPIFLMSKGYAGEDTNTMISSIRSSLQDVLKNMKTHPNAVHVIKSHVDGIGGEDITKAFLLTGLGSEYADVVKRVHNGVLSQIRTIAREARLARSTPRVNIEEVNLAANFASDGWEQRIEGHVRALSSGRYLLVSPAPKKELKFHPVSMGM